MKIWYWWQILCHYINKQKRLSARCLFGCHISLTEKIALKKFKFIARYKFWKHVELHP